MSEKFDKKTTKKLKEIVNFFNYEDYLQGIGLSIETLYVIVKNLKRSNRFLMRDKDNDLYDVSFDNFFKKEEE